MAESRIRWSDSSVGWLGTVAGFLPLNIAAVSSQGAELVRSAHFSMNVIGGCVIVPASILWFLSGLSLALFKPWGMSAYGLSTSQTA